MVNASRALAAHIDSVSFEDLDPANVHWAKQRIADSLGVLLAGVNGVGNDKVKELVRRWDGRKEASIFASSDKALLQDAAWINSFMLRAFDFEVIDAEVAGGKTLPAHITGTTVPVMFAVGEYERATGKDMLCALILADDIAARLIGSVGFGLYDCFDGNGTANCMGATALASKLMGLDSAQISDAWSLALNLCGGSMENVFQGTWAFKLPLALSARHGIMAAEMAQVGLGGVEDAFFDKRCYFDMFGSDGQDRDALLADLGETYYSDIVVKPWPSCHATQYGIDAALEVTDGRPYSPEEIESIRIRVSLSTKGFVGQDFVFGNTSQPAGAFSLRYTVASAVLRGTVAPQHYAESMMAAPALGRMLEKLEILDDGPKKGAIVEIVFADGHTGASEVNESLGHMRKKPLSDDRLYEKFMANVAYGGFLDAAQAEELYALALDFDELENLDPILRIVAPK